MAKIQIGLPKGRMQKSLFRVLEDAGITVQTTARGYRPVLGGLEDADVKILKPQNVVTMLHAGTRDVGFAGADWVAELGADLVEVLDTGLDKVRVVAAAPSSILVDGALPKRPIVIASELERITRQWMKDADLDATFVRTYGATEVFPPEDADCIVDIAQTGATLKANDLDVVAELLHSSTRLYASQAAMQDPAKRDWIEGLALIVRSVIEARDRVMIEVNVTPEALDAVVAILPCMKTPTVAQLHKGGGYAVKVAVRRSALPTLIPLISQRGGTDIVVSSVSQIVA